MQRVCLWIVRNVFRMPEPEPKPETYLTRCIHCDQMIKVPVHIPKHVASCPIRIFDDSSYCYRARAKKREERRQIDLYKQAIREVEEEKKNQ